MPSTRKFNIPRKLQDLNANAINADDLESDLLDGRAKMVTYILSLKRASQFLNTTVSDVLKRVSSGEFETLRSPRGRIDVLVTAPVYQNLKY